MGTYGSPSLVTEPPCCHCLSTAQRAWAARLDFMLVQTESAAYLSHVLMSADLMGCASIPQGRLIYQRHTLRTWPPASSLRGRRPTGFGSVTRVVFCLQQPIPIVVITHKWDYISVVLFEFNSVCCFFRSSSSICHPRKNLQLFVGTRYLLGKQ